MEVFIKRISLPCAQASFQSMRSRFTISYETFHLKKFLFFKRYPHQSCINQIVTIIDTTCLNEVGFLIKDIVDFEESSMEARFIVKRGVDEEVANIQD